MLHIIVNPIAGNGRAQRVGGMVAQWLEEKGVPFVSLLTEGVGHATVLAREAADSGAGTVVALGGDGTVLETMRGIIGTGAALGIIPAGTGNDVVKMLGIPGKPQEALDHLLAHPARSLDAGLINGQPFLNVVGTGFDVCVLDYALTAKRYVQGMLPYLWGVIRTIFTYSPVTLTVQVDDEPAVEHKFLLAAAANGRFIGGGLNVAPVSLPDDGLFDLVLIDNMPRRRLPPQLIKLLQGRIREIPGTIYRNCKKVTLSAPGMRMNIDGEITPMERAEIEIVPGALMAHW